MSAKGKRGSKRNASARSSGAPLHSPARKAACEVAAAMKRSGSCEAWARMARAFGVEMRGHVDPVGRRRSRCRAGCRSRGPARRSSPPARRPPTARGGRRGSRSGAWVTTRSGRASATSRRSAAMSAASGMSAPSGKSRKRERRRRGAAAAASASARRVCAQPSGACAPPAAPSVAMARVSSAPIARQAWRAPPMKISRSSGCAPSARILCRHRCHRPLRRSPPDSMLRQRKGTRRPAVQDRALVLEAVRRLAFEPLPPRRPRSRRGAGPNASFRGERRHGAVAVPRHQPVHEPDLGRRPAPVPRRRARAGRSRSATSATRRSAGSRRSGAG